MNTPQSCPSMVWAHLTSPPELPCSRNCLRQAVDGEKIIPFVRSFYGQPSTLLWEDDAGEVHSIPQGEGGEQGDPLMPLLFCLGQHPALAAVSAALQDGERLFAYLDDLYIICRPETVGAVLRHWLWVHSGISLHAGETKVWSRSGLPPHGRAMLQRIAVSSLPDAVAWRGDHSLPPYRKGFKVLGVPFGHPEFVKKFIQNKISEHRVLL